ncbi:MAG: helix-turn-helix transcriptional regulator [Lentisphaerae bacterium]|nr:helix-turn-helix transcriptional regulator [Lentisphaerota bacterium]MCP4101383.1 helix-turn-helix transcriptional regulator [Lentisphaerota bacterium]
MSKKEKIEICHCNIIHNDIVEEVRKLLPGNDVCINLAEFYKAFADQTRLKILKALLHSEMCVCDLTAALGMTQSAISHQLRILKNMKLVKYRKAGKVIYYSLDDNHIKDIFKAGFDHINE